MTENSSTNPDIQQIESIIRHCGNIEDAVSVFGADEDDFLGNLQFQNSCAFSMIQIGERVKRLSSGLISKHPSIEWKDIAKFRDVLSHNYDGVNLQMVWKTVKNEISVLKEECKSILNELRQDVR